MSEEFKKRQRRWRLVLGEGSEEVFGGLSEEWQKRDRALGYLYGREYGASRNVRSGQRSGGLGESTLTIPEWINDVHSLFPQETVERIEKDALERYQLQELVTSPELLRRATPSMTLLKAVLHTKHLMNEEVLKEARRLVSAVVRQLLETLARPVEAPFYGVRNRQRRSRVKLARNFDAARTIKHNLKNYCPKTKKLVISEPWFFSRSRSQADKWSLFILVDQSGSMLDSVIHSAVTAAIFWGIKALKTRLILFDTNVVDVTDDCQDPVDTLLKVQLGGGTDIGSALSYAASLVENPRQTIVILISDFFEGGPVERMLGHVHALVESGVHLLGLAALDSKAKPTFDRDMARRMVNLGAHVGAMTPGELAAWVSQKVR